jgi:TonB family C-terminal domain
MKLDKDSQSGKPKEVQLSFMDYQLGNLDFVESKNKSSGKIPYAPIAKNKTPRFLTMSAMVHAAALFTLAFASFPLVNDLKTETVTIELQDSSDPIPMPVQQLAKGEEVPATQGSTPQLPAKEDLAEQPEPSEMAPIKAQAPAQKIASEDLKLPKAAPITKPAVAQAAKPAAAPVAKTTMAAVPATIEDIQDPELEKGEIAEQSVAAPLADDLDEDLEKVNHAQAAALSKEKEQMDQMAAAVASEQDETLNSVANEAAAEDAKLAAMNENLKKKNADSIAKAQAAERAEKEANDRAEQEAAAAQAAATQKARDEAAGRAAAAQAASLAAAKAHAKEQAAKAGSGEGDGSGAGNSGDTTESSKLAGAPTGVRSLEQLRQKPGNPRPMYSPQERLLGQKGDVGYLAYITKEGVPTQFRLIKSTGHQNLDSKTLTALKKWKFYPGQEGWVELPFKWDLKGETQEAGGLLRNSVSSR